MASFKNNMGQVWEVKLSISMVRKLNQVLGFDVLNGDMFFRWSTSLTDRLAAVYLLCESQAKEYEVSIDEFEDGLTGEGFADAASDAFFQACIELYNKLGQASLKKLAKKQLETIREGRQQCDELLDSGKFDEILDQMAERSLAQ